MTLKKIITILSFLVIVILSSTGALIKLDAAVDFSTASSVDSDLAGFGIEPEKFKLDMQSNQEPSCLMFAMTIQQSSGNKDIYNQYLYIYNPSGIENYNIKEVQIRYSAALTSETLLDLSSLIGITNYHNLKLLSISSNKTVAKYLVLDLDSYTRNQYQMFELKKISYNLKSDSVPVTKYQALGDRYIYNTSSNGNQEITYEYEKMNNISIKNTITMQYIIQSGDFSFNRLKLLNKGSEYWFYGFKSEGFTIDDLYEVEMVYQISDSITYRPINDIAAYYQNEDVNDFTPKISNTQYVTGQVITPYSIQEENAYFFKKYKYTWDSIMSFNEAKDNSNSSFSNFINTNFINTEWIVTFYSYNYSASTRSHYWDTIKGYNGATDFANYLTDKRSFSVGNGGARYDYYEYNSKLIEEIEIVRLKFKSQGEIYNLSVIVDPINSSGTGTHTPKNDFNIIDWLYNFFLKLVNLIMVTFKLNKVEAMILAIALIVLIIPNLVSKLFSIVTKKGIDGLFIAIKSLFRLIFAIPIYIYNLLVGKSNSTKRDDRR